MSARILVADDERSIRTFLKEAFSDQGFNVTEAENGDVALQFLTERDFDIAFLDIRMPGQNGLEILAKATDLGATASIVIITAQNTMENAVEAMKRGAFEYLVQPFGLDQVQNLAKEIMNARALADEMRSAQNTSTRTVNTDERLVGRSKALLEVFKTVGRVASSDVSVLITGESGTGKELVARAIHSASARCELPFIAINAAAIPHELLESELFGHERGAFTGAVDRRLGRFREANGGTLFLDEIGDMPIALQSKLLRVLQSGQVTPVGGEKPIKSDVRIVTATHRDLDNAVSEGAFREDLLYRLRVIPIDIPPLRDRNEDIEVLANYFMNRYGAKIGSGVGRLSDDCVEFLKRYHWPGNVRELENAVKRGVVLSASEVLTPNDFKFLETDHVFENTSSLEEIVARETDSSLDLGKKELYRNLVEKVERPLLARVLLHTQGNQIKAASILGINRNTLRKKIVDLNIDIDP
ncbi:sigma-54 dependent transcriptional regulator [Myxococcota bacterium]|nr:sigma-54 dependent transcriptional regulator [Myxococcota bacterium]